MAAVAMLCMYVWECEFCPAVLKAHTSSTVWSSSEYHMWSHHKGEPWEPKAWDPPIERRHWAFHIRPDDNDPKTTLA